MPVTILGIRHHGPGSARSLLFALETLRPDVLLVEGPPEAEPLLPLVAHEEMKPPIALLLYAADHPRLATFYPLAVFSPEWQAIQFAAANSTPLRFMDLPQAHHFAIAHEQLEKEKATAHEDKAATASEEKEQTAPGRTAPSDHTADQPQEQEHKAPLAVHEDPLNWLAAAAGFEDGESWWEHMVEHRRTPADIFPAIAEAMTTLRKELPVQGTEDYLLRESRREAFMRQCIRAAEKEFQKVAVVCGAWHVPALQTLPPAKDDAAMLKALPRLKVQATCVPWTHGRLSFRSGYGAGIDSPGWYHHLWTVKDRPIIRWMTRIARLLRREDLDASSAHIIEAVRLSEALASLRERPLPSLAELNEATLSVLCHGNPMPLQLIQRKLIVGEQMGSVPAETPAVPLQQDVAAEQRRLRLKPDAEQRELDLDLRNSTDLERSHLLHRLRLLGIAWGEQKRGNRSKGTFHEIWKIEWEPEFEITVIERGSWGNTLPLAATAYCRHLADQAQDLPALTALIEDVLLAELPQAAADVLRRIENQAALANDALQLMTALPPLANVMRYGNVRGTEVQMVEGLVQGLVVRICVGLPLACSSLNDEAAQAMFKAIIAVNAAIAMVQQPELTQTWYDALVKLASQSGLHGLVAGRAVRLLQEAGVLNSSEVAARWSLALSSANEPITSAAWCEGFLQGSGLLLIHDQQLWHIIDEWICALTPDHFIQQVAILRRTFSSFQAPERRQLGERVAQGEGHARPASAPAEIDLARAKRALPLVAQLLGLKYEGGAE
jgi:hypothetical protein